MDAKFLKFVNIWNWTISKILSFPKISRLLKFLKISGVEILDEGRNFEQ